MDKIFARAKRHRSSSSSSSSSYVWMLSHSRDGDEGVDEYQVYYVDLDLNRSNTNTIGDVDGAGYTHIHPTFRYDGGMRLRTFCILGSTLYIFEGYTYDYYGTGYRGKSAYKFELCPSKGSNKLFKDSDLERLSDMHSPKFLPCAIRTPDGKRILVFACGFRKGEEADETHFELYDPLLDSWEKLPEIPSHFNVSDVNRPFTVISAYSFIDEHHFYIQLESGMFVLDTNGWNLIGDPRLGDRCVPWNSGYFLTVNKVVFLYEGVYDANKVGLSVGLSREQVEMALERAVLVKLSSFPDSDDIDPFERDNRSVIPLHTVHGDRDGVVNWCAMKSGPFPFTEDSFWDTHTRVLIDACATNLNTLKTRITKSLRLLIDQQCHLTCLMFVSST